MDFLDDLGLRGERGAAGVGFRELVGGFVHDLFHFVEQFDDLRHGLLDGKLLDVRGKLVLLVRHLAGAFAMLRLRVGESRQRGQ